MGGQQVRVRARTGAPFNATCRRSTSLRNAHACTPAPDPKRAARSQRSCRVRFARRSSARLAPANRRARQVRPLGRMDGVCVGWYRVGRGASGPSRWTIASASPHPHALRRSMGDDRLTKPALPQNQQRRSCHTAHRRDHRAAHAHAILVARVDEYVVPRTTQSSVKSSPREYAASQCCTICVWLGVSVRTQAV